MLISVTDRLWRKPRVSCPIACQSVKISRLTVCRYGIARNGAM